MLIWLFEHFAWEQFPNLFNLITMISLWQSWWYVVDFVCYFYRLCIFFFSLQKRMRLQNLQKLFLLQILLVWCQGQLVLRHLQRMEWCSGPCVFLKPVLFLISYFSLYSYLNNNHLLPIVMQFSSKCCFHVPQSPKWKVYIPNLLR